MGPTKPGQVATHPSATAGLEFAEAPDHLELADDEVHLWLLNVDESIPPRDVSRRARAHLMQLLARYGGTAPPPLCHGEHGKPYLAEPGFPHFNLSHGGRCMLFAFAKQQEIGIDVDALARRHSPLELARRFFAEEEARALEQLDAESQGPAFMRLWTGKEAVLKALGLGLSFGLHRLRFDLDETGQAGALQAIDVADGATRDWQLHRFEPAPGYAAALAWRGPTLRVRGFRLDDA